MALLQKPKNIGKAKKQKKTKENQKTLGKTKNQSFLRFQTSPWIWVWFFLFFGFPRQNLENQKNIGKTKKTKIYPRGGLTP